MYKLRIQLFKTNRKIKTWDDIITEFNLENKRYFSGMQLINGLPWSWERNILEDRGDYIRSQSHIDSSHT